jgi:nitrogen fixation NifU-like protein
MSDDRLQQLYQDILLDHNKQPRHYGLLEQHSHRAEGYNPLCGDRMELTLQLEGDRITAAGFEAASCAICQASASIMAEALPGKSLAEVAQLEARIQSLLAAKEASDPETDGDFAALAGVSHFPARVKCATLPWHTFDLALTQPSTPQSDPVASPDE